MLSGRPPQPPPRNGLGTAALILGIAAVVFGFVPLIGMFVATPSALGALVTGLFGFLRAEEGVATNKGVALTGAVLGLATTVLMIVFIAATIGPVG